MTAEHSSLRDATLVRQTIASWESWPGDVRERLRAWNRDFLLSFRRNGDFHCDGCEREIAGHPNGNAVVRHHRKAHGVLRCEDCLVALARANDVPPAPRESELAKTKRWQRNMSKKLARYRHNALSEAAYVARLKALLEAHREEYVALCREYLALSEDEARQTLADFEAEVVR